MNISLIDPDEVIIDKQLLKGKIWPQKTFSAESGAFTLTNSPLIQSRFDGVRLLLQTFNG